LRSGAHPTPRTSIGPRILATGKGSRFHAAIISRYLGLSGLFSGMVRPSATLK
jgi:hypothetical protein